MMSRFCTDCGAPAGDGRFCSSCGATLRMPAGAPEPPPAAPAPRAPPAAAPERPSPLAPAAPGEGPATPRSSRRAPLILAAAAVLALAVVAAFALSGGSDPDAKLPAAATTCKEYAKQPVSARRASIAQVSSRPATDMAIVTVDLVCKQVPSLTVSRAVVDGVRAPSHAGARPSARGLRPS